MDHAEFWRLLDGTIGHENRTERLTQLLDGYTPEQIVRFALLYDEALENAATVDLWGAAHVIHGGCDDDTFTSFREGLIERGQNVYSAAVQQPDSLADIAEPGTPFRADENLGWAAMTAWLAKTGQDENAFYAVVDELDTRTDRLGIEAGDWWNFDDPDEMTHRLPRLAAKFLHS